MKNILFISLYSNQNSSRGSRHQNIVKYLSKHCHITVVRNDSFIDKTQNISQRKDSLSRIIKIIYRYVIRKIAFPDEFIFIRRWYISKTLVLLKNNSYDAVILGILPHSFYKIAGIIKRKYPLVRLIVDISDPLYGNVKIFHSRNKIVKYFAKRYEKKYLAFTNALVVMNDEIKKFYEVTFGLKNVSVIEQGIDDELITKIVDCHKLITTHDHQLAEERFVIVYGGMFYEKLREPFELYKAVETSEIPIKLKLFGKIKDKFLPVNSTKIEYYGRVSQECLFNEYSRADCLVFLDNAFGIQVPGKACELLFFNKPVLFISSNKNSPSLKYFRNYDQLVILENDSAKINFWFQKRLISRNKGFDHSTKVEEFYWKNLILKYLPIINEENGP